MSLHPISVGIPTLLLKVKADGLSRFISLFQFGCFMQVLAGSTLRDLLDAAGFSGEYLEKRVQTVFLNGSAIDDFDSAVLGGCASIALSAAMPGLAGAILRKGSPISALRSREPAGEDIDRSHCRTEMVRLKLFNVIAEDMGPKLLEKGVIFGGLDVQDFLSGRRELLRDAVLDAELDGALMSRDQLFQYSFSTRDYVLLRVS